MNRFSRALMLRRCLHNWTQVGRSLRGLDKNHASRLLGLHFRTGVNIDNITASDTWPLLFYSEFAQRLRIFSNHDLETLASIANDIQGKLTRTFTTEEILISGSTGAGFNVHAAFLFLTVRKFVPSVVVETGVAQGISSYLILKALQINGKGKLISIDLPNRNPEGYVYPDGTHDWVYTPSGLEPGWIIPSDLRTFWELKLGRSSELLPTIEEDVNVFYHDSEHSYQNMTCEYEWAYNHLKEGGILASDDVDWNEAFFDFTRKRKDMRPLFDKSIFPSLIKTKL